MNITHVQMRNADDNGDNGNNTTPMRDMTTGITTKMHIEYESFQIMRGSSSRSLVFAAPTKTMSNERVGTNEEDHEDEYKREQEHQHDEAAVMGTTPAHPVPNNNNYDKYHCIVDEEDTIVAMREQNNSHSNNINAIITGDAPAVPHQTIMTTTTLTAPAPATMMKTTTVTGTTTCTPSTTASTATTRLFCGGLGITEDNHPNGHHSNGNDPNRSTSGEVEENEAGRRPQQNGHEEIDEDDGLIQEALSISVLRSYARITKAIQRTLYACLAPNPTTAGAINEDDDDEVYIPSEIVILTATADPQESARIPTQTTTPQQSTASSSVSLTLSPRSTPPLLRSISSMSESIADSYTLEGEPEGDGAGGDNDGNGGTGDDDYFETRILANFIQSLEN